jgi:acyl-CoA hydrolase/GNAT superfamily N-acetyltransferase
MSDWKERYRNKIIDPASSVRDIRRGMRVFVGSGAAEPQALVRALADRGSELADNQIVHLMTLGVAPYVDPRLEQGFRHNAFFIGANTREAVSECRADYTPIFLSEIPRLLRSGRLPIDVALVQTSPPDHHGYLSLGVSVDICKAAAESARAVIAQVNPRMPRVHGDAFLSVSQVDLMVPHEEALLESHHPEPDEVAQRIGQHVADLIENESTLQMGIGTIPDAVLACLSDKRDLGIHTEMFSDGVIDLVEKGVVTGRCKALHPGKIVTSFVLGSQRLYEWVHDNPSIEFHPSEHTNDPFLIARHDRMVSINSALEVDLTGQVCADSIGEYFYSGIGGQVDFIRGAGRSRGGKAIIALPSTARGGKRSRIQSTLQPGAGVVTSRGDVHYVVTEFGAVNLHGKSVRERALSLIHIAHPDFREELMREARRRNLVPSDQVAVLAAGTPELAHLRSRMQTNEGDSLLVRPICPTDEDLLRQAFHQLSEETIRRRFFHVRDRLLPGEVRAAVSPDFDTTVALVAVNDSGPIEQIVAVGSYIVDPASQAAELAFTVRDDWQGQGVGAYLFERLLAIGHDRGVVNFVAFVQQDNTPIIELIHRHAPGPVESRLDEGVLELRFSAGQTSAAKVSGKSKSS